MFWIMNDYYYKQVKRQLVLCNLVAQCYIMDCYLTTDFVLKNDIEMMGNMQRKYINQYFSATKLILKHNK